MPRASCYNTFPRAVNTLFDLDLHEVFCRGSVSARVRVSVFVSLSACRAREVPANLGLISGIRLAASKVGGLGTALYGHYIELLVKIHYKCLESTNPHYVPIAVPWARWGVRIVQPDNDSIARTSSAESARSRAARSCFMCSASEVPVSGSMPTARAKRNTT